MKEPEKSMEQSLEEAVSRALRDNLTPLQRTADELQQAYADFVAACSSSRPSNTLPAMLRAQTAASSLAAGLSVLSNLVAVAFGARERTLATLREIPAAPMPWAEAIAAPVAVTPPTAATPPAPVAAVAARVEEPETRPADIPVITASVVHDSDLLYGPAPVEESEAAPTISFESPAVVSAEQVASAEAPTFDIEALPGEQRDLHRRANRVAKVAMQDIKLLRPADVRIGRDNKDICYRLRIDIDKARKEYDRRFRTILDHPVDYFHYWMVTILADGDAESLGEYPYPSPVLRH